MKGTPDLNELKRNIILWHFHDHLHLLRLLPCPVANVWHMVMRFGASSNYVCTFKKSFCNKNCCILMKFWWSSVKFVWSINGMLILGKQYCGICKCMIIIIPMHFICTKSHRKQSITLAFWYIFGEITSHYVMFWKFKIYDINCYDLSRKMSLTTPMECHNTFRVIRPNDDAITYTLSMSLWALCQFIAH